MSSEKYSTNILIVDDDSFIRSLACDVLLKLGYENTESAANGIEAIALLENTSRQFDVIVCDLNMPEMNGVEFMQHAAKKGYTGGLILFSAEDMRILEMAQDMAATQGLNIIGTISKPFTSQCFSDLLDRNTAAISTFSDDDVDVAISEAELRAGLLDGGSSLVLFYQPIVHISSGDITAVESIPMWQHPERGLLEPEAFLPVAEQHGLLGELSLQIYSKAVQQTIDWLTQGVFLQIFIRLNRQVLSDAEFIEQVVSETELIAVKRIHLNFMISESEFDDNDKALFGDLMRLHFNKIGVAMDDFGLGNSTLDSVNSFPFTLLQTQRELISTTGTGNEVVASIRDGNDFRSHLDSPVALKGIDNRADWDFAEIMGIEYVQGEFCSKALPSAMLLQFVESWSPPPRQLRQKPKATPFSLPNAL